VRAVPKSAPRRIALGVVVAVLTAWQFFRWRRAHRPPAEVRESRTVALPANPTGRGVVVAVNPHAGSNDDGTADAVRTALPEAEVVELDDPADLEDVLAAAAQREGVTAIGAAGGDGTLNRAAAVAHAHQVPLLAIPGGTLNHFARDLGLREEGDALVAVAQGTAVEVDLAHIDGRTFLNTASFGSYAELVDAREALEGRLGKWTALAVAAIKVLRHGSPIEVDLDGQPHLIWMIFIGNCRYQPDGFAPSHRARLDDGQLDLRIIDAGHPWSRTRLVLGLVTGRLGESPVYRQWAARQMLVRSGDGPLRLAADGETFDGGQEVCVEKVGDRLTVYASESLGSTASGSSS
jgi:diacylglycerol kinase family enzyme